MLTCTFHCRLQSCLPQLDWASIPELHLREAENWKQNYQANIYLYIDLMCEIYLQQNIKQYIHL